MKNVKRSIASGSTLRLLLLLGCSIFGAELFSHVIIHGMLPEVDWIEGAGDATLLLALLFPSIYFLVYRPLKANNAALSASKSKTERLSHLYSALSECNKAIVRCVGEEELFLQICRAAVQFGGMKVAWIGIVDNESLLVRPAASFGDDNGFVREFNISVDASSPFGGGPTGKAIRENRPYWSQDIRIAPEAAPWRDLIFRYNLVSVASLPLHRNGVVIGAFLLYTEEVNSFDEQARGLLTDMASDISFALDNFAIESQRKQAEVALKEKSVQLADIISFLPDATMAIDAEKRIIIWNRAIEKMTGIPAAEMLGKGDYAYTIPFYGEARPHLMDLVFLDSGEIAARYPAITHEGNSITAEAYCNALYNNQGAWVFAKASPLHNHAGKVIGAIEIVRDINERKQAEHELKRSHQELHKLSRAASEALEDERRRTARELHDELGQTLTVLKLDLGALRSSLPPNEPDLDRRVEETQAKLDIMVAATRRIAANLRPMILDDLGLAAALDWLTQNFSNHTGIATDLAMDDRLAQAPEPIASTLYRIVQESLTNVTKYAQATKVGISLECDGNWILLRVGDNGRGIDVADQNKPGHFGLLGIRERVLLLSGEFTVTGKPGRGTELLVRIPLAVAEEPDGGYRKSYNL